MGSDPIVFNIASVSMIYTSQKRICHNLWQNWLGSNYELSQALPNELCNGIAAVEMRGERNGECDYIRNV